MSVTGYTKYGDRNWSGTESSGISPDSMTVSDGGGFLTKDAYDDSAGDFDFEVEVTTNSWGSYDKGGIAFCVNKTNIDSNYVLLWTIGGDSKFKLFKNNTSGKGDTGTQVGSEKAYSGNSTSFKIKIQRVSNVFSFSFNSSAFSTIGTDSSNLSGNIGFVYPSSQWNGYTTFKNPVINVTAPITANRVILIT